MNHGKTGSCENLCFDKLCYGYAAVVTAVAAVGLTGLSAVFVALWVVAALRVFVG